MMAAQTRVIEETPATAKAGTMTVKTRFGDYEVVRDRTITMPKGLIGLAGLQTFALLNLPEGKGDHFKLLQSLDEPSLGFYVLPVSTEASGFDADDIAEAARLFGIPAKDLAVLLVITARRGENGVELTANLRAPIILDTARQVGHQHVMASEKYPLRQRLN
ncbi:MAG TPA: flagellar assembly protein FliW [Alphaproteobacteria bacterium]|nr:flagellar assembly protein FliW [Alphaproteobacteria bacterium]